MIDSRGYPYARFRFEGPIRLNCHRCGEPVWSDDYVAHLEEEHRSEE